MRPRVVVALALAVAVIVVAALVFITPRNVAAPTPVVSPTVAAASASTPSPSAPPATATPAQAQGRFVNAALRYSIVLPQPWHPTPCGSFAPRATGEFTGRDTFIRVPDRELESWDVGGISTDHVYVFVAANNARSSPGEWASRRQVGALTDVTYAGQPAVTGRLGAFSPGTDAVAVFVAQGDLMYEVARVTMVGSSRAPELDAIVSSFHFEPNAVRPSPTPPTSPARSAEDVADILADGFAKKDISVLARVITPCVTLGAAQGGASGRPASAYLDDLRERFARGLTVTVRARPLAPWFPGQSTMLAQSTWREPGQPDREADLIIAPDGAAWIWQGTITFFIPRSPP